MNQLGDSKQATVMLSTLIICHGRARRPPILLRDQLPERPEVAPSA